MERDEEDIRKMELKEGIREKRWLIISSFIIGIIWTITYSIREGIFDTKANFMNILFVLFEIILVLFGFTFIVFTFLFLLRFFYGKFKENRREYKWTFILGTITGILGVIIGYFAIRNISIGIFNFLFYPIYFILFSTGNFSVSPMGALAIWIILALVIFLVYSIPGMLIGWIIDWRKKR